MPRKRLISPQFFTNADLYDAEVASGLPLRLVYAGLWCQADRRGYFEWRPRELKLAVMPHDPVNMTDTMLALCRHGFLKVYERDGRLYGVIPSFSRWQTFNIREKADAHIPEPLTPDMIVDTVPARYRHGSSTPGTGSGSGTGALTTSGVRKQRARRESPKPLPPGLRHSWLTPASEVWETEYGAGTFEFGRAARAFKRLHDAGHSPAEIAEHLRQYLRDKGDPNAAIKARAELDRRIFSPNINAFATTFESWNPAAAVFPDEAVA